jgi:hypothetical protein
VGDKLNVTYVESVAVGMALPSDDGETVAVEGGLSAPEGAKPAAAGFEMLSTVVEFISYDPSSKIALVEREDGSIFSTKVSRELRSFARARVPGDRIAVDIASGFAVAIEPSE